MTSLVGAVACGGGGGLPDARMVADDAPTDAPTGPDATQRTCAVDNGGCGAIEIATCVAAPGGV
ncbi:MAG: hypothetical protein R2939_02205, partial [Kofleriaceae bacterium]